MKVQTLSSFALLLCLATQGAFAKINIHSKIETINGRDVTLLDVSNDGKSVATLEYDGAVRSIKTNSDKTICAINLEPGTQINDVYLVESTSAHGILVIKDFNAKVLAALGNRAARLNTDYISVYRIEGKILDVRRKTRGHILTRKTRGQRKTRGHILTINKRH